MDIMLNPTTYAGSSTPLEFSAIGLLIHQGYGLETPLAALEKSLSFVGIDS